MAVTLKEFKLASTFSELDRCDFMINFPDMISIPEAGCPIPPASYSFNTNLLFDELWLAVNGDLQVSDVRFCLKIPVN